MSIPHRLDAYVRVSRVAGREGASYISPSVQREQIQGWAKLRGVEVGDWHEDFDQSGGKLDRPGLNALLARIKARETEGVVVAKLDRLSRLGVADALKLVEQITNDGGQIAAVDLGIDPTTPFGEFGMTIMLALGRMERRRLGDSWAIARERAIARGAMVGPTPYGYRRLEDGTNEPHPVERVHVQRAYELAAAQGARAACRYLRENAPSQRHWDTATTRRMLGRRTYLGESGHGEFVNASAHEPLVSRAIWEAAQTEPRAYVVSGTYPLSGVCLCGTCGATMAAGPRTSTGKRAYRCSAAQTMYKGAHCPRPATIVADNLEDYVREGVRPILADLVADAAEGGDDLTLAERAVTEAELELEAFASDLLMRRALGDGYHDQLALRVNAVEGAQAQYRTLAKDSQTSGMLSEESLDDPKKMGILLRSIPIAIRVAAGRGKVEDRVAIYPSNGDTPSGE
jgi:DNA invertase Pin-like site-specific DNA recombinase